MAAQTAGAGRGKQGGPTAKQLADYERKQNAGIFTEGMPVPQDIDGASVSTPKKMAGGGGIAKQQEFDDFTAPPVAKAKGGKVSASSRGDGIAQRGKTKGRLA